jgi:glucose-6-phosphate 1-dehydrogenase
MLETLSGRDPRTKTKDEPQVEAAPVAPPCAMVIFGAAGDLTKRLVVPALYNLVNGGQLPDGFRLVGVTWPARPRTTGEKASPKP